MKATWKKYEVHHSWESDRLRGIGISVTNLCVVVPRCLRSLKSCNTTVQRPLAMYMWDSFSIGSANSASQAWSCQGLSEAYHRMSMTLATYTESPLFPPWHIDMLLLNPKILQRYRKVGAKGSIFAVSYVSCHQCACICERSKERDSICINPWIHASWSILLFPCICKEEEKSCPTLSTVVSRLANQSGW